MHFRAITFIHMILICSIPVLKAHSDGTELKVAETSVCHYVVKGGILIAGFMFFKVVILPMLGITSSGIVPGSIADKVYIALINAKGYIITKNSFVESLISKQAVKYGLSVAPSIGKKLYQTIDPYLSMVASYVCE